MEILPGTLQFNIYPEGKDKFFATWEEYYLNFERDKGKINQVIITKEGDRAKYI